MYRYEVVCFPKFTLSACYHNHNEVLSFLGGLLWRSGGTSHTSPPGTPGTPRLWRGVPREAPSMLDGTPEHQEHNVYKAREREGGGPEWLVCSHTLHLLFSYLTFLRVFQVFWCSAEIKHYHFNPLTKNTRNTTLFEQVFQVFLRPSSTFNPSQGLPIPWARSGKPLFYRSDQGAFGVLSICFLNLARAWRELSAPEQVSEDQIPCRFPV